MAAQFVRVVRINDGEVKPTSVSKSILMSYIDTKCAFQTDIPQLLIIFTNQVALVDFEEGMSLFALPRLESLRDVCIVQHNDGMPRDFDYVSYGHLMVDLANRDKSSTEKKSTIKWPVSAPPSGMY